MDGSRPLRLQSLRGASDGHESRRWREGRRSPPRQGPDVLLGLLVRFGLEPALRAALVRI